MLAHAERLRNYKSFVTSFHRIINLCNYKTQVYLKFFVQIKQHRLAVVPDSAVAAETEDSFMQKGEFLSLQSLEICHHMKLWGRGESAGHRSQQPAHRLTAPFTRCRNE
ncbi:hypothetical protein EVAR_81393_1 [Eumeta japonica]|uniref:Uncharacterized protein n=1 Tax=Eumeta variegata TaxID=151549 RepID=A0A4C1WI43_EUMVA|nr:hypothetical protein EVAR_81393_1 [Eumeta japonica]